MSILSKPGCDRTIDVRRIYLPLWRGQTRALPTTQRTGPQPGAQAAADALVSYFGAPNHAMASLRRGADALPPTWRKFRASQPPASALTLARTHAQRAAANTMSQVQTNTTQLKPETSPRSAAQTEAHAHALAKGTLSQYEPWRASPTYPFWRRTWRRIAPESGAPCTRLSPWRPARRY